MYDVCNQTEFDIADNEYVYKKYHFLKDIGLLLDAAC